MLLIYIIGGYVIGSIPTAYLIVRFKSGKDLRTQGSSNIGALNVYSVTGSKWTGIVVGILDAIKGILVVIAAGWLSGGLFKYQSVALLSAIIGHNYPVWLKFHGGKGLATAAGGLFGLGIAYTIFWCITWFISFRISKNVLKSNLIAILTVPVFLLIVPSNWILSVMIGDASATDYRIFSFKLSVILVLSHLQTLKEITGIKSRF